MSNNMKNEEFESVRGVSAVVVSLRAAHLLCDAKRNFVWWLQSLSLKDGGFRRVARELLEMFPDRLGTPAMRKAGVVAEKNYTGELVGSVEVELGDYSRILDDKMQPDEKGSYLIALCRRRALTASKRKNESHSGYQGLSEAKLSIEEFLIELCTNPKIQFALPGVDSLSEEFEAELACDENPDLAPGDFKRAELVYFRDIIGALLEYRARHAKQVRENFHLTAIGNKIWETLGYALASRNMVLLDGLEGRGKTEAVKAWCEIHGGQARFVNLKGITNRTIAFREIAAALGITYAYGRTGPEMQARVEDVLARSKIMLVVDEAHFLFNQTRNMTARPELVDWIDTALCNRGVPVALVTTPQFIACMARAKNQVEWNFNQFRRRVKRWVKLPDKNGEADLAAVARKVFPDVSESALKKILGYALLSRRDLSAVGDVAGEVRAMRGSDDLRNVSAEEVHQAITEFLIPSDLAFKVALDSAELSPRKTSRRKPAPALSILPDESYPVEADSQADSPEFSEPTEQPRPRSGLAVPARGRANPATIRGSVGAVLTAA
jgi:DNA transposition AAA+ family ATPase